MCSTSETQVRSMHIPIQWPTTLPRTQLTDPPAAQPAVRSGFEATTSIHAAMEWSV